MSTLFDELANCAIPQTERNACQFTVYGRPVPQGSMKAFHRPGMRFAAITSDNKKLKPWRQQITETAISLGVEKIDKGQVSVCLKFYFARPKSAGKRIGMTVKPDVDKLVRAIFDALTGVLFQDDSQVVGVTAWKHYGDPERVEIQVSAL